MSWNPPCGARGLIIGFLPDQGLLHLLPAPSHRKALPALRPLSAAAQPRPPHGPPSDFKDTFPTVLSWIGAYYGLSAPPMK